MVSLGGQIFVVSGSMGKNVQQYVIGGLEIKDKLSSQLAAYDKYPEHRLRYDESGQRLGNIIVTADGQHHPDDHHNNFDTRIQNYLVGANPVVLETEREVALGREHSLDILAQVFDRAGATKVREVIGRMRKLTDDQAGRLREALLQLKSDARR